MMNRRTKFSLYSLLLLGFVAIVNLLFLGGRLDYTTNNNNNKKNHRYNHLSSTPTSPSLIITPTRSNSTSSDNETHDNYGDTTIIITSNFIPSHPSTELIDETIESFSKYIHGLNIETTPIIITVDGAYKKNRGPNATKTKILHDYVQRLYQKYDVGGNNNNNNIKILTSKTNIMLVGNVQKAIRFVQTEFVYIIQHDMPFIATINHNLLLQVFQNHPKKQIRLVRFSPLKTLIRNRDKGICNKTTEEEVEIEFYDDNNNNSIHLSKTHTWSDGNHFTRKSYYDEIFTTIQGWENTRYMEEKMKVLGKQNCSYWGTYLYGSIGDGPTIIHRDGRRYYGTGGDDDGDHDDDDHHHHHDGDGQSQQQQQQSFVSELMQIDSLRRKY